MTPFQLPAESCETVAQPDSKESKEGREEGEGGFLDNVFYGIFCYWRQCFLRAQAKSAHTDLTLIGGV